METEIYVRLLDEGVQVYRPVPATRLAGDIYLIGGEAFHASVAETEEWEFLPGARVVVEERQLSGGRRLVAAREAIQTNPKKG